MFLKYASQVAHWRSLEELEAMLLSEYVSNNRLGELFASQGHNIAKLCFQYVRLRNSWEAQDHDIVRVCLRDAALESFSKLRAIILPNSVCKMSDCATLGELKAMILSEYASEMPLWKAFWKLDAIILPKYASKMSDRRSLEKLKAMILSEYACEMPHNPALGGFLETHGHNIAKLCNQSVRS